jgi:hypothetical protein
MRPSARSCAVHLELKEAYGVIEEDEPYRRFMAGEDDDFAWRDGYFELMKGVTARGVAVRRVRLVTEPLNDYARFLLHITPGNIAVGEDVRYRATVCSAAQRSTASISLHKLIARNGSSRPGTRAVNRYGFRSAPGHRCLTWSIRSTQSTTPVMGCVLGSDHRSSLASHGEVPEVLRDS